MFSSRTPDLQQRNALTDVLEMRRSKGLAVFDLTVSNPTRADLPPPPLHLLDPLTSPEALIYQADPRGIASARAAVAQYYFEREGLSIPIERIFLTASTSEAYGILARLLANPGDGFYIPRPSYPLFEHLLSLDGVLSLPYEWRYEAGWYLEQLPAHDPRARAMVLVNPNNPTGGYLKEAEYRQLTEFCTKHQLALISDEVFADYRWENAGESAGKPAPACVETVASRADVLSFSLGGLSKTLLLPQLKLAWMVVNGPQPVLDEALERLEFINDTYLSVSTPIQLALPGLLAARHSLQAPVLERLSHNHERLKSVVERLPWVDLLRCEGGWYRILKLPSVMPEEQLVVDLLDSEGVLVHPGYFFDFMKESYLVLSLLTPESIFEEGLKRLAAYLERHLSTL